MGVWKEPGGHIHQMNCIVAAAFERCETLEKENLQQNDLILDLSQKVAARDGLEREAILLKDGVARYETMVTELQMKEKEHTVDIRLKTKAAQVSDLFLEPSLADSLLFRDSLEGRRRDQS
jgi:hypothetical protein